MVKLTVKEWVHRLMPEDGGFPLDWNADDYKFYLHLLGDLPAVRVLLQNNDLNILVDIIKSYNDTLYGVKNEIT